MSNKYKLRHKAREQAIKEFTLREGSKILSSIGQEPHIMKRNRDGTMSASQYWRVPLYKFWTLNNGMKDFDDTLKYQGETYSRYDFYLEPITRADLAHHIKKQLAEHGYRTVYVQHFPPKERYNKESDETYWTEEEVYVKVRV